MTTHYKDAQENIYGFKPYGVEVVEIDFEEVREILDKKSNPKEKTALEKIRDLENSITERNKQEAILGDEYAIAIIQSIRDQISDLRLEL